MGSVIFLIVALGAMYALMILPQQKRVRLHEELLRSLVVGDDVLCASGLYGTIVGFEGPAEEVMQLEVADGVVVLVARSAVTEVAVDDVEGADDLAADDGGDDDR